MSRAARLCEPRLNLSLRGTPLMAPVPWRTVALVGAVVLLPVGIFFGVAAVPPGGASPPLIVDGVSRFPASRLALTQSPLGPDIGYRPLICNVQIVDLDDDG